MIRLYKRGLVGGNRGNDEGRLETTLESNTMVPAAPGLAPALGCLTWPGALPLAARLRGICRWGCSLCSTASSSCICLPRPGEEDWRRGGSIAKVGVPNSRSAAYCSAREKGKTSVVCTLQNYEHLIMVIARCSAVSFPSHVI